MIYSNDNFTLVESLDKTSITLAMGGSMIPNFKSLVQRAMNTWADAPAELKEFADLLLDGKIQQDYKSQI